MKKRSSIWQSRNLVTALCLALMLVMTGCGSGGMKNAFEEAGAVTYSAASKEMASGKPQEALTDSSASMKVGETNRKLIKTVNMRVETKEYDALLTGLSEQISSCGGYVEQMETYNGSIYSNRSPERSANMTIRIPEARLEDFLDAVSGLGNVIRRSETVEDVTLTYVDLESHKEALETEQSRLLELLEKAETVEDIITIEQRLSQVRYQLESMESQLRTYDNKISYSTVYLDIEEVRELTPVVEETVWQRISGGFVKSIQSVADGFVEFVIWLLVNSPFLVIWTVVITLVVLLLRFGRKKRVACKAVKEAAKSEKLVMNQETEAGVEKKDE